MAMPVHIKKCFDSSIDYISNVLKPSQKNALLQVTYVPILVGFPTCVLKPSLYPKLKAQFFSSALLSELTNGIYKLFQMFGEVLLSLHDGKWMFVHFWK